MVRIKKYFYVLRPVLACQWIEEKGTMPPMAFDTLVETQDDVLDRLFLASLQEVWPASVKFAMFE